MRYRIVPMESVVLARLMAAVLTSMATVALAQSPRATAPDATAAAAPPAVPGAAAGAASRLLDRVVAVVNDEVITQNELNFRARVAEQQLQRQQIATPPREVLLKQVLERMIIDRAQLQMAKETGVRVDDATVNAGIGRIAEQNGMTLPAFRARLEQDGVTFNRFREDVRDDITMVRLRDREVDSRVTVSEGELDNFLAEQAGVAAGTLEFDVAQIQLRVPDSASTEAVEAVRKRADELLAQLKEGADFAKLAASFSSAPEALSGGDLGWRTAERLPTLFLDAVKDLPPGQIGPVVRSPGGFHILKLSGRRKAAEGKIATGPVQQTRVRHILLRVSDLTDRIVKGGQDFGQLARLHSVDPSSTRGGELGWMYPGDTVPEFERAMEQLKPGDVSDIVQSPFGFHLIQVLERKTEENPVERGRLTARQALRDRKAEEQYQEWLRQLRDRTYVEYHQDEA